MNDAGKGLRIAVVGGGISGISAAWRLQQQHEVTLFEAAPRLGGHTNTVTIESGPDAGLRVDTGFIVCNRRNYPLLQRWFADLEVPLRDSDMSFSFHDRESGLQYAGRGFNGLFAQRMRLLDLRHYRLLLEIRRFGRMAQAELLRNDAVTDQDGETLADFLERGRFGKHMTDSYLLPMGAAIWSMPADAVLAFPFVSFARFFDNHGLLTLSDQPQWQTVAGGSCTYVERFLERFEGRVHVATPVRSIRRTKDGVYLHVSGGEQRFDKVVLACHADQSLALLAEPSADERHLLGAWRYSRNHAVLHSDSRLLPPNRRAWASWNYTRHAADDSVRPVNVTYHMNRLMGLTTQTDYCVTLNAAEAIDEARVVCEIDYRHPVMDRAAVATQAKLPDLNGVNHTFFCGAWFGHGFHEDGFRAGVRAAELLGGMR